MNHNNIRESLYLYKRHICCDESGYYLFPPNRGTDGFVECDLGNIKIHPVDNWHIDLGDGGVLIPVKFCPFCGERLKNESA